MSQARFVLFGTVAAGVFMTSGGLLAAELAAPARTARAPAPHYCGPCGCLTVGYVHHRDLQSTYGLGFDPRNFDTTQPYYYFGRMHAYPKFYVDGMPQGGTC